MTSSSQYILLIERGNGSEAFTDALQRKGYTLTVVTSGRRALTHAEGAPPTLIVINAASLGSSGLRICSTIAQKLSDTPLIHILPETCTEEDRAASAADIALLMPFTSRKLVNRIKRLMPVDDAEHTIETGHIRFVPELRLVFAYGREKRLTPKAARLLEVFLSHPDKTLKRLEIMKKVWDTDYVGDTRTLDVHVRWVREAIEPEPNKPQHIQTVRGVGYRFVPTPTPKRNKKRRRRRPKKKKADEPSSAKGDDSEKDASQKAAD